MKKLFLLLFVVGSSFSVYSQAAVIDVAAQNQLTTLNTTNSSALARLAEQVGTAAKQLSQLEKTYETVKKTADKIEKVNNAVQSYNNMAKYIAKQSQIVRNIQEVASYSKKRINPNQLKNVLSSTTSSLKKIQSFLMDDFFNMTDKERIELIEGEDVKMEINLLRSKMYLNSIK